MVKPRNRTRPALLSIVVPAFNEEAVLAEFYAHVSAAMDALDQRYEIVFVNDGSADRTLSLMEGFRAADPDISIIDLSRNFGKEIATTAGIDHAAGDAVVIIDADLQDPPGLIKDLIAGWREGYDVVYAQRLSRRGESWLKRKTARIFYRLMHNVGPVTLPKNAGDFRLMSRSAVDALKTLREQHRFMKGLFSWIGFSQKAVCYHRDPRFAGETKWNYWKLWNLSIEGFTSFTVMPLKISTYLGTTVAGGAFLYALFFLSKTIFYGESIQGFPTLIIVILGLGGVQLVVLGVMGEYLGRIFNETKLRPLYLTQSVTLSEAAQKNAHRDDGKAGSLGTAPEREPAAVY